MNSRFDGKTVLITGAGSGIGQDTSLAFAQAGATVIGIDRSQDGLAQTAENLSKNGARFEALVADVSSEASIGKAIEQARRVTGQIDCAFNNAGITQSSTLTADLSFEEWQRVLAVNVTGVWLCMRAEIKVMQEQGRGGSIVNTASFLSMHSMAMQTAYVASKYAVLGITRNAAIEYAEGRIRVNAVAPGGIPTGMMAQSLAGVEESAQAAARKMIADLHPMKRLGTPREIAQAVMFLSSEAAGFITGSCLSVDGGWAAL
ncbi:2,5-dichloro-2,5-cyclohexadiene-1,4-diol dehydrogenase [Pseudomonas fluorescens]|uniref:2,5-dichloro-2,5-cyclohexadiene-1,4-diol dehydrogenase n=1 Tax=Pseudomonas fluorescens TaxID=294 RepID=A0A8H2RG37_PSEFL|nr:SDR family NAD(P)-dependent oxidoreductase [Pseudomonas fluorescens]VVO58519.1 2,5-dichloro-2,5-cyclohexadiene-1,4-diol dehydrogenase [Pseudomonas fluorescens]